MKNEQLINLENQLNDLVTRVTDFESRAMRQGQQANEEFTLFKNELDKIKSELHELKKQDTNGDVSNDDLEAFGKVVEKYLQSLIDEYSENTYDPEFSDACFDIRYSTDVYLSSVDVSTNEIRNDIKNDIDFANVLNMLSDNAEYENLKLVVDAKLDYFREIFDKIEESFVDELPNGFYTLDDVEDNDMEINFNSYDKCLELESLSVQFGSLIEDNMQSLESIIDNVLADYYSDGESQNDSSEGEDSE